MTETNIASQSQQTGNSVLQVDLEEKQIVYVVPTGATIRHATTHLPGGALIQGEFNGTMVCERGALIIAEGAMFSGYAEADEIYIAGSVGHEREGKKSRLIGRALIAVAEVAKVHADMSSRLFSIHTRNISGHTTTLEG